MPHIDEAVTTAYRFGLDLFDPAGEPVNINVERGERTLTLQVRSRAMPGGYEWKTSDSERTRAFFGGMAE